MRRIAAPVLLLALAAAAHAQNSAGDMTLRTYVKPQGSRLHLLVRAPLSGLTGVTLPYRNMNGELDLARTDAMLPSVARWWIADNLDVYEDGLLLPKPEVAARVSIPSDNAFRSYESAWLHLLGARLPEGTQIFREQAMFDVMLDYPINSASSHFAIRPGLAKLASRVTTDLQFLPLNGSPRNFEFTGYPGLFYFDPSWGQVVQRFASTGFGQVLAGTDYLLLFLCIALDFRRVRQLASFAAIFAIAQSMTLILSTYNLAIDALWFPLAIEALMALSILFLAFEAIAGGRIVRNKWILAIAIGVIFGYAFSFALKPARQFAGGHELTSILCFNLGLELGGALVLAVFASGLAILFRFAAGSRLTPRTETIVLAVLAADLAWHRLTDRVERLSQFSLHWPQDATPGVLGWVVLALIASGAAFLFLAWKQREKTQRAKESISPEPDALTANRPGPSE